MRKLFLALTLLLPVLALVPTLTLGTRVLAYTSPGLPQGFVNDFGQMLSPSARESLETKLKTFKEETGHELSVVTVPNLGGDTVENFAVKLFEEWKIGEKNLDNGVLLLISKEDRELKIEVGYGLEGALTDAQSYWIIQEQIIPEFKKEDYEAGINAGVDKIIAAARGEVLPTSGNKNFLNSESLPGIIWFVIFIVMWLASILARSKSWWGGGVVGGVTGAVIGFVWGFIYFGLAALVVLIPLGLLLDYLVSKKYAASKASGINPPWWAGGGGFHGGGGFGGFGGGSSGGGGASGRW